MQTMFIIPLEYTQVGELQRKRWNYKEKKHVEQRTGF